MVVLACLLGALALRRLSPAYRPVWAGYTGIALSALAVVAVLWFTSDTAHQVSALGSSVDVDADSLQVTPWPWITLCCFLIGAAISVFLVPRSGRGRAGGVDRGPATAP
ncbi:hypothetical protein ACLQ3C_06195 [Gordonia sp. DT30]|uniref:hypothetical protein n=1 Tax=unclassified Gordonia (in: high G+C Gram-positive bacteria) TaxID=2657482 RepID=UPI003CF26398